jgi:hypothetical protein
MPEPAPTAADKPAFGHCSSRLSVTERPGAGSPHERIRAQFHELEGMKLTFHAAADFFPLLEGEH